MTLPPFLASLPLKWIGVGLAALLVVAAVFFSIRAYGNAQYNAGVAETDAQWKAAAEKLEKESNAAAATADENATTRETGFTEALTEEKEKLDAARDTGTDPFDVIFDSL